jgi:hypothetical protein
MDSIDFPETSARNYHYSLRNNTTERSCQLFCGGSFKPRKFRLIQEPHDVDKIVERISALFSYFSVTISLRRFRRRGSVVLSLHAL